MVEGVCQFCFEKKKLCRAHIFSQSITKYLKGNFERESGDLLFTNNQYPKRVPNGIYDSNILCNDCDCKFSQYENCVLQLLFQSHRNSIINYLLDTNVLSSKEYTPEQVSNIYEAIRKFTIFTLWKASISKDEFVKDFSLGKFENDALKILQGEIVDDTMFKMWIWDYSLINNTNRAQYFGLKRFNNIDTHTWCYFMNLGIYGFYIFPNNDSIKGLVDNSPFVTNFLINKKNISIYPMPLECYERHNENFKKVIFDKKK